MQSLLIGLLLAIGDYETLSERPELSSVLHESRDHIWYIDAQKLPVHRDSNRYLFESGAISINLPKGKYNESDQTFYLPIKVDTAGLTELYSEDEKKPKIPLGTPINFYDDSTRPQWKKIRHGVHPFDKFEDWNPTYVDESFTGPMPFGSNHRVQNVPLGKENDPIFAGMDRHSLSIVMKEGKPSELYETYRTWRQENGAWMISNGARFSLRGTSQYKLWPTGWTSSNAAGIPFTPLLIRRDEAANEIKHALAMTIGKSAPAFVWPATHHAGNLIGEPNVMPMGMMVRSKLTADDVQQRIAKTGSGYKLTKTMRNIVTALHRHGAIIMDNGARGWVAAEEGVMSGTDRNILAEHFTGEFLEVIDQSPAMISPTSSKIKPEYVSKDEEQIQ